MKIRSLTSLRRAALGACGGGGVIDAAPAPRRLAVGIVALALSWPLIAAADCTTRKPRAAEIDFNTRALAALVAALPPAPAGVQMSEGRPYDFKVVPAVYEVLCDFSKEGDFSVSARRSYLRKHSEAEREYWSAQYDALQKQAGMLRKMPAEKVAQEQVLRQQSNLQWQAARDAEKAGDKLAAQAPNAQYRALRNQADAIQIAHDAGVKPQLEELDRRRTGINLAEQRVEIVVAMNLQRLPVASDRSVVGSHGPASPGKSAGLRVNNVAWSADGVDGSLRRALTGAIDRARLQALVGAPLPAAAESEAFAARAVPVLVAGPSTAAPGNVTAHSAQADLTAVAAPTAPPTALPSPSAWSASHVNSPTDSARKAVDTVNQLRGLLGR